MHQNPFRQNSKDVQAWNRIKRPHKTGTTAAHCLTLHMKDGRKMIFYYAFLLSVELLLMTDHSVVVLRFTSQKVTLKGYRLDILFNRYAHEKPAVIQVYNGRYIPAAMKRLAVVTDVITD